MIFEEQLRSKIRKRVKSDLEEMRNPYNIGDNLKNRGSDVLYTTKKVLQNFLYTLDEYNFRKYEGQKTSDEIFDLEDEFLKLLTESSLSSRYEKTEFTEEEKIFIEYAKQKKEWRGEWNFSTTEKESITDVLLRRILLERYSKEEIEEIKKILKEQYDNNPKKFGKTYNHFSELLSDKPFASVTREMLNDEIEKDVSQLFDFYINCGGYSLQIDSCIFPFYTNDINKDVSTILDTFPFVRLLGDQKLNDDEYLVLYRSAPHAGHHFIRIDDDDVVREKDGSGSPRIFEDWAESLKDSRDVVFAVKKDHKMFGYESSEINYNNKMGLNFEETIESSILQKENTFSYHGHEFSLKKGPHENEVVVLSKGDIVAYVLTDEETTLVERNEEKSDYIDNLSGNVPVIIKNGRFLNRQDFIQDRGKTETGNLDVR